MLLIQIVQTLTHLLFALMLSPVDVPGCILTIKKTYNTNLSFMMVYIVFIKSKKYVWLG